MAGCVGRFEPGSGRRHGPQCRRRCRRACRRARWDGAERGVRSRHATEADAARGAKRRPEKVWLEAPSGWRRVGGRSRSRHSLEGGGEGRGGDCPRRGQGGSLSGEAGAARRHERGEASARCARAGGGGVGHMSSRDTMAGV